MGSVGAVGAVGARVPGWHESNFGVGCVYGVGPNFGVSSASIMVGLDPVLFIILYLFLICIFIRS